MSSFTGPAVDNNDIGHVFNLYKEWEREAGRLRAHLQRAEENARYWKGHLETLVGESRAASGEDAPV